MALRRKQCRAHGGIFSYHPSRGQQPVSCKPEYPCDRANMETPHPAHAASDGAYLPSGKFEKPPTRFQGPCPECGGTGGHRGTCSHSGLKPTNPSLPLAKAAKERLTAVGWVVQGRGWIDDAGGHAQITASREHETLSMEWENGAVVSQIYAMEFEKPSTNNYPENDLHFDPAELSDSELVRMIRGMKVTWWNTIGSSRETAIVNPKNVTVEHIFRDENGDEDNSKRIVKFIDYGGGGFKAFHVAALLRVG